ncbi:hypothetical protein PC9H_004519 [Pleurotus ostreatus]|uniref:Uncharacterized protein n=1 Tax=Pleurotus ostreatus TaxID=5322 RepID=A0A8H7DTF9_PLEOS|nr:uncharacterized protein PC9H_004519 [Pleurotus ostreatus]KAF7432577.1 hypothetical protein PC9H_004519 [Pleurotus ostreatus]
MSHTNTNGAPVSSVFSELSTVPSPGGEAPPVTDLIRLLLQVVAQDVCSSKRNTMSLYSLLSRSRDICGELHTLIQKVDETGDWESYESYSSKVQPLEELLYKLFELTGDESTKDWPSDRNVMTHLSYANTWEKNRGLVEVQPSDNFDWVKKHDDLALFHTILEGVDKQFAAFATVVTPSFITSEAYTTVRAKINGFESQFASDTGAQSFVIATKFVVVMDGLLGFVADKSQALEKRRDLLGKELWKAAKDVVEKLDQPSWDEFVRLLSNAAPSDIEDLVKLVKRIRRPFHSQSMVLVKYCYQILNKVKAEKKEPGVLKSALAATEEALSAAADVVKNNNDLLKFEIDAAKKTAAETKFTAATAKITDCITTYTLAGSVPFDNFSADTTAAQALDKKWMDELIVATDLATVKVTITNPPAGLNTSNQTFTVEKNCSASTLLSHSLMQLRKDFRGTLPHRCHLADPSKNNEVIAGTTLVNAIPGAITLVFKM